MYKCGVNLFIRKDQKKLEQQLWSIADMLPGKINADEFATLLGQTSNAFNTGEEDFF